MKRVLCVWLPDFPIQRLLREQPTLRSAACVLYEESGNRAQVVVSSREAKRLGIHPGMSLAEGQALTESAAFFPHDADADAVELQALARHCHRYSPLVGLDPSREAQTAANRCLVLDIAGCGHLFGGETGLTRQLVVDLAERGYFAHVAVASTMGAAWAIARYGHRTGSDRRLRSLPIEALRIPEKIVTRLHEFDLRTVGELSALPRESLPSRFGAVLTERLDQLFGRREELLERVPLPEPVSALWTAEEPICHQADVLHVCSDLLTEILCTINARSEGLLKLTLFLHSESTDPTTLEVSLTKPVDSLPHLINLLHLKLETHTVPEWLHTIRLEASVTAALQTRQRGLFSTRDPSGDAVSIQRLVDRLSVRLGPRAVVRPQLLPEAVPEQAVGYESLASRNPDSPLTTMKPSSGEPSEITSARPLVLLSKPAPVEVVCVASDGLPMRFYWQRREYRIAHCTAAERIATGWWQDTGSVQRDYYRVETQSGARFWLFRDEAGHWFLHGLFD